MLLPCMSESILARVGPTHRLQRLPPMNACHPRAINAYLPMGGSPVRRVLSFPLVLLALSVPAGNERGPLYMDQALAALHRANPRRRPLTFLLAPYGGSVRLCCRVPEELRAAVLGQFYAQYPDCRIEALPDDA